SRLEGRIRELEESNRELTELDRTKDDFIQLASHELRTPLTLITGYMRLMIDSPELSHVMEDENTQMLFNGLADSVDRMQVVVEEILTTSRIIVNRIELNVRETNLAELVMAVIDSYREAMQMRRIQLHFRQTDWPTEAYVDPEMIYVAIRNLVSNAIKYTPDGGQVYLNCAYNTDLIQFSVRDTGIGISSENQASIFKRMHITGDIQLHSTSKTAYNGGGLGLGLSICSGIIEAHHGKIWVQSEGHDPQTLPGSEFFVELPIEHPEAVNQKQRKPYSASVVQDVAN
ncbi:MAG: HAMP domain-containing histidine kinase, partial [Anaerolineae bacterium]|nr:HAMP domain-containing histidine kinase [Anaerolineae bacterium]